MPWLETEPVRERKKLLVEWLSGDFSITELSERHGVSRKTAYKWIGRYEAEGPDGLTDRSRRPHHCPQATRPEVLAEAFRLRTSRRTLVGAKKVRTRLLETYAEELVPSERTLHKHFTAQGLVKPRRRKRKQPHPGRPTAPFDAPNSIWSADFKGQFKTRDGVYCYPLTVQDGYSRYLLGCQGLDGTRFVDTKRVFRDSSASTGSLSASAPTTACRSRPWPSLPALTPERLVDRARHPSRPHRARQPPAERPTRAHAPHPQGRDHHPARGQPLSSAAPLQRVPFLLQRGETP